MLLSNSSIQKTKHYINCITYEGKVVLFDTAPDGKIYYTVKRDGYEYNPKNDNKVWEDWPQLEFPNEDPDPSVVEKERKELTRQDFPNSFITNLTSTVGIFLRITTIQRTLISSQFLLLKRV